MWSCYGVHITVWHSLFVYLVSQFIKWSIPTSARFLFRNVFEDLWVYTSIPCMWTLLASSFIRPALHLLVYARNLLTKFSLMVFFQYACCPRTCSWRVILTCALMNGQYTLPSRLPAKKRRLSYTQRKAQMDHTQRISRLLVAILNAIHNHVTMPGRLKKEAEKFWHLTSISS